MTNRLVIQPADARFCVIKTNYTFICVTKFTQYTPFGNYFRKALQKYPEQSLAETDLISDIKVKNPTKYVPYVDLPPLSVALLRATSHNLR